jgi:hypothetical protein
VADDVHRQQAGGAFLYQRGLARFDQASLDRRISAADAGVPGKGQFLAWREDAHAVIRRGRRRRQQKSGFGKVGPAGKGLHGAAVEALAIHHDGQRIAAHHLVGEHIELQKTAGV